jgi:preprotein translocase subunit YajC
VEATFLKLAGMAVLFAADEAPAGGSAPVNDPIGMLNFPVLLIVLIALFYFMMIRPHRREQAQHQAMLAELKKNDRVLTASGIFGVVTNVQRESNEVTIKVDEATNTKIRVTLSSIATVLTDEPSDGSSST